MTDPVTGPDSSLALDDDLVDFGAILALLWARRWRIVVSMAIALLLALLFLNVTDYEYRASMTVIPVSEDSGADVGGGLSSLASIAGVSLSGAGDPVQFQLFIDGLTTHETAQQLLEREEIIRTMFRGDWDAEAAVWREPASVRRSINALIDRVVGRPVVAWRAPDAARVKGFLDQRVAVDDSGPGTIVEITIEHPNREFAIDLLAALREVVDERLRARALERASASADYLRDKLEEVRITEVRLALAQALSAREQERMLASSSLPFAADPVSGPTAPLGPSTPVPILVIFLALTLGVLVGIALALLGAEASPAVKAE